MKSIFFWLKLQRSILVRRVLIHGRIFGSCDTQSSLRWLLIFSLIMIPGSWMSESSSYCFPLSFLALLRLVSNKILPFCIIETREKYSDRITQEHYLHTVSNVGYATQRFLPFCDVAWYGVKTFLFLYLSYVSAFFSEMLYMV